LDWEAGITRAFQKTAAADGLTLDPAAVMQALRDAKPESEAPAYRTYREVLTDAALRVGGRLGWTIDRARAAFLPDSLPRWMPFADTNPALVRLRQAGYALGILSNVDDDLLAETLQHLTVPCASSCARRRAGIVSTRTRDGCTPVNRMANTARPEPEPNGDQLTQAVTVGLRLALAAVLLVLALVP
jgi:hypothetical protein